MKRATGAVLRELQTQKRKEEASSSAGSNAKALVDALSELKSDSTSTAPSELQADSVNKEYQALLVGRTVDLSCGDANCTGQSWNPDEQSGNSGRYFYGAEMDAFEAVPQQRNIPGTIK